MQNLKESTTVTSFSSFSTLYIARGWVVFLACDDGCTQAGGLRSIWRTTGLVDFGAGSSVGVRALRLLQPLISLQPHSCSQITYGALP